MAVGTKPNEINKYLSATLNIKSSRAIVNTIISFGQLLEPSDANFETLADGLVESFGETQSEKDNAEGYDKKIESLRKNLLLIFKNSKKLKLTLKAYKLKAENENVYSESRIISDIRLVFNDELQETKRSAIILHRLHLNFLKGTEDNEVFFTLDLEDLNKLKEDIERAIKKDQLIQRDYFNEINFIQ